MYALSGWGTPTFRQVVGVAPTSKGGGWGSPPSGWGSPSWPVSPKEVGFSCRAALGISTLDSESSDRGSNPREVSCTPASFDELRSVVRAVGAVLLGFGLFAVGGFSAGFCVGPSFGLYCCPKSWQHPEVFPGGPPPQY